MSHANEDSTKEIPTNDEPKDKNDYQQDGQISDDNDFNDLHFEIVHTIRLPTEEREPWIRHIEVLSDGNLLLADRYNRQLLLFDSNGRCLKQTKLTTGPWNITVTNDNLAAITLPDSKAVAFVAVDNLVGSYKISVNDDCRGIACIDNKLIVNCVNNGLKVLTMTGRTVKVLADYVGYMNLSKGPNDTLICSLFAKDLIVCMKLSGDKIYEISHKTLHEPCSLAFDDVHGYLFVVGHHGSTVHIFRDKGKKGSALLTKREGINRPWATGYDSRGKTLYISNFGGKVISVLQQV